MGRPRRTVLVPYVAGMLHPGTVAALAGVPVTWARIDPGDVTGYQQLLREQWSVPGDLVVVEHDMGVPRTALAGFWSCRQPWCTHRYTVGLHRQVIDRGLGCVRFTGALKRDLPGLLDEVAGVDNDGLPAGDWRRLDVRLAGLLALHGVDPHVHEPQVEHYHRYGG